MSSAHPHSASRLLLLAAAASFACAGQEPATQPPGPPPIGVVQIPVGGSVRSSAGVGIAGVSVSFTGIASPALTSTDGTYSLQLSRGYSGSASATKAGCTFLPATRAFGNVIAAVAGQDFAATCVVVPTQQTLTLQSSVSAPQITISPADLNGNGSGSVPFARSYRTGVDVSITTPAVVTGAPFAHWEKNGVAAGTSPSTTVTMDRDYTLKAVYATVNTISGTVKSSAGAPIGGVTLAFSGIAAPATTTADGIYFLPVVVGYSGTVTPAKTGCTFSPATRTYSNVSTATPLQDYVATCPVRTLTVQSSHAPAPITVSPLDLGGGGSGSAPFTRSYGHGSTVTLTAPGSVSGTSFDHWEKNGVAAGGTLTTTVVMDADITMKAVYASPQTISGTVRTSEGTAVSGVSIAFTGIATPAITNTNGVYFMSVAYGYVGTATASRTGCSFFPEKRSHANVISSTLTDDFVATCVTRVLTVVSSFSSPAIAVSPTDLGGSAGGITSFTRFYGDGSSVTLTAANAVADAAFHHWERNGVDLGPSATATVIMDTNLTMRAVYANPQTITGTIRTITGATVPGVSVTFTGIGLPANTTSTGIYQMIVPFGYSGTATPSKPGCTFTPASRTHTNVVTTTGGQNFTSSTCP